MTDFDPITIQTPSGIKIHALMTGTVAVKPIHKETPLPLPAPIRLASILAAPRWTEMMPIYVWVIEHPEGIIVVDTGESSEMGTDAFFKGGSPPEKFIYNSILRTAVAPEQEIGPQMRRLGLDPNAVRWVIQTHLHSDHMDGMGYFPNAEFILSKIDYPAGQGVLSFRFPSWLRPSFTDFRPKAYGQFDKTHAVTASGDVLIVPTPGHANGHQSVLLLGDTFDICFAGDASFDLSQVRRGAVAGISASLTESRATLARIRAHLSTRPTIYLPSHDASSGARLKSLELSNV